jgi:hypothetical protein
MTVHAANNHTPGVRTFYVKSEAQPGVQYVVQFIRRSRQRRWYRGDAAAPEMLST